MNSFGTRDAMSAKVENRLSIDGAPEWRYGGVDIDWDNVTAEAADGTVGGREVKAGEKVLPLGTLLVIDGGKARVAAAADTIAADSCGFLDGTVSEEDRRSAHSGLVIGGHVAKGHLKAGETVAGVAQPALADILAVLPRIVPVA